MAELVFYDPIRKYLQNGTVDLDTDTLKCALLTSAYSPATAADWIAANSYALGTIIKVSSKGNRYYEAMNAGISSGTIPSFSTTRGVLTTDNSITWKCWGFSPPSIHTIFANVSANEIVSAGYVAGGTTLTGLSATHTLRTGKFTSDAALWSAALLTGIRYGVLYKLGTANAVVNPLLAYILLNNDNTDVSMTLTGKFSLDWSASGLFNFS